LSASPKLNELLRDHGWGADVGRTRVGRLLGIQTLIANDFISAEITAKAPGPDIHPSPLTRADKRLK
jgi:hypothetical protein